MGKYKKLQNKFYNYKLKTEIRFDKIEKHLDLNTEVTVSKVEIVEELPEKWCYKASEEMNQKLYDYCQKRFGKDIDGLGWMYINSKNNFLSSFAPADFTIINDDQFKKWVLKEDSKTPEIEGIKPLSIREVQVKVSSQEEANECAEIAKAFECNISILNDALIIYKEKGEVYFRKNIYTDYFGVFDFYENFKIISIQEYRERFGKAKTEIDWSKAGQLVENESGYTWITTGIDVDKNCFEAVLLKKPETDETQPLGRKSNSCRKYSFHLCTEPITLSND